MALSSKLWHRQRSAVTAAGLNYIVTLPKLHSLCLPSVGDECVPDLWKAISLRMLIITDGTVSDKGAATLNKNLSVDHLYLGR